MTYLVFVEGGETPKVHHYSLRKAEDEALRLYTKLQRKVFVCKVVNALPTQKKDERVAHE